MTSHQERIKRDKKEKSVAMEKAVGGGQAFADELSEDYEK
jgi:hypothetical protein